MGTSYPWAPNGTENLGKPPVNGAGGERGSSAFAGDNGFDADGYPTATNPATHYPRLGVDYYVEGNQGAVAVTSPHAAYAHKKESANKA